jgi:hypothetical protein
MAGPNNYPNGVGANLTIREIPIHVAFPGRVFWVYNGTALQASQRGGSNGNKGTLPVALLDRRLRSDPDHRRRGDIIMVKPGHTETISDATSFAMSTSGVAIVGLGTGSLRPTFTLDTANTATIPVSAANCAVKNCIFTANFLSIAACFTVDSAKNFAVEDCYFVDTSSVLNFLNIVKTTGGANTADGLTFTTTSWTTSASRRTTPRS